MMIKDLKMTIIPVKHIQIIQQLYRCPYTFCFTLIEMIWVVAKKHICSDNVGISLIYQYLLLFFY